MAPSSQFGKPKAAADGGFTFQVPQNAKDGGGRGRIPKGQYVGKCVSVAFDFSKAGNPMWTWEFGITKGKIGVGRTFKMWTVLTDDAAWKIVETLEALGIPVEPGTKLRLDKKKVIGTGCTLHIVDDDGQDGDEEWSKLKKISAHPEGAGFRPGGLAGKKVTVEEEDEDESGAEETDEGEDEAFEEEEDLDEEESGSGEDGDDDTDALLGEDEDEDPDEDPVDEEEEAEEEPAPRRRTPAKTGKTPPKPARGKAPASLGKRKR